MFDLNIQTTELVHQLNIIRGKWLRFKAPCGFFFYMWMILLSCGMQRDLWWQSQGSSKLKPPVRASQAAESWIFEIRNHELFCNISSSQNYRTAYVYRIRYFFETRCNYIILYLFLQAAEKRGLSWNGFSESTFVSARLFLFCFPHMKILFCDFFS